MSPREPPIDKESQPPARGGGALEEETLDVGGLGRARAPHHVRVSPERGHGLRQIRVKRAPGYHGVMRPRGERPEARRRRRIVEYDRAGLGDRAGPPGYPELVI